MTMPLKLTEAFAQKAAKTYPSGRQMLDAGGVEVLKDQIAEVNSRLLMTSDALASECDDIRRLYAELAIKVEELQEATVNLATVVLE